LTKPRKQTSRFDYYAELNLACSEFTGGLNAVPRTFPKRSNANVTDRNISWVDIIEDIRVSIVDFKARFHEGRERERERERERVVSCLGTFDASM